MASTVDPAVVLAMLPLELKLEIKTLTFFFQMVDYFGTNSLKEIAARICLYTTLGYNFSDVEDQMIICWLNALVSYMDQLPTQHSMFYSSLTSVFESHLHIGVRGTLSSRSQRFLETPP